MRLVVDIDTETMEDLDLGDRVLITGHVTKVEQDRLDVTGFHGGAVYEESMEGETRATFAHDAILVGDWVVRHGV